MLTRWKPNVTVAGIIEHDGLFLLVEEQTADGLRLNNPAGHLEQGESLAQACMREVLEETAHPFVPTALVGIYLWTTPDEKTTYLRFAFCGEIGVRDPERALDAGIVRTVWLTAQQLRETQTLHRSPLVLQCVEDYLKGQRFSLELIHTHFSAYHLTKMDT